MLCLPAWVGLMDGWGRASDTWLPTNLPSHHTRPHSPTNSSTHKHTHTSQIVFIDTVLLAQETFHDSFKREVKAGMVRALLCHACVCACPFGGWIWGGCVDEYSVLYTGTCIQHINTRPFLHSFTPTTTPPTPPHPTTTTQNPGLASRPRRVAAVPAPPRAPPDGGVAVGAGDAGGLHGGLAGGGGPLPGVFRGCVRAGVGCFFFFGEIGRAS